MKLTSVDKYLRSGILRLFEQIINSSLSFLGIFLIYAKGSDSLITQIALCSTYAYGVSAIIKGKVLTNLYLRSDTSDLLLQIYVIKKIQKGILLSVLISPLVPFFSYSTDKAAARLCVELTLLICALTSLDLLRNLLIHFQSVRNSLLSGIVGIIIFFGSIIIDSNTSSQYRLDYWITSLFATLITLIILERNQIFQNSRINFPSMIELEINSKKSFIESLVTTAINVVSFLFVSQFLVSFGAEIQRIYVFYCAIPMVFCQALTPRFNLMYRNRSVHHSHRLIYLVSLEFLLLAFPLLMQIGPQIFYNFPVEPAASTYLVIGVIISIASNLGFIVYAVFLRSTLGFKRYFQLKFAFLCYQNFVVLFLLKIFGEKHYFYAELLILFFVFMVMIRVEKSNKSY